MNNVTRLRHVLPMSPDINASVVALDKANCRCCGRCQVCRIAAGPDRWIAPGPRPCTNPSDGDRMTIKVLEFKWEDWRDADKTLRKIADYNPTFGRT